MSNNKSWYELYMDEINQYKSFSEYINKKMIYKKPFLDLINKYAPNKKIIETGCGTGAMSIYLASKGYDVLAIDIDEKILSLSKSIAEEYDIKSKPKYKTDSIFELKYRKNEFDVSFSNGVLEHFNDEEIIDTLKKQLLISNTVIFGIPTKYFDQEEAMYGNERFMPLSKWRDLIHMAGGTIIEETSCHFTDKLHIVLNIKKYFRPYPFRIFVVKK